MRFMLLFIFLSVSIFSSDKVYDGIKKEVTIIENFVKKGLKNLNVKKEKGEYNNSYIFYVNGKKFREVFYEKDELIVNDKYFKKNKIESLNKFVSYCLTLQTNIKFYRNY